MGPPGNFQPYLFPFFQSVIWVDNCYIDRLSDDLLHIIFKLICEEDQANPHDSSEEFGMRCTGTSKDTPMIIMRQEWPRTIHILRHPSWLSFQRWPFASVGNVFCYRSHQYGTHCIYPSAKELHLLSMRVLQVSCGVARHVLSILHFVGMTSPGFP
jgi:hypothetical protein